MGGPLTWNGEAMSWLPSSSNTLVVRCCVSSVHLVLALTHIFLSLVVDSFDSLRRKLNKHGFRVLASGE